MFHSCFKGKSDKLLTLNVGHFPNFEGNDQQVPPSNNAAL